ncbi:hypothetical protein [Methylobacterium sp. B4]|uniref:hypothetical protein n=1 Tax=Methylobacterium sp. B4 TaxID=1938755 RepID=UPI0011B7A9D2|nr:hypothetical protein [Methylobacterium sp. B4]
MCKQALPDYDERLHIKANGQNGSVESYCSASSINRTGSRLTFRNTCTSEGERFKSTVSVDIVSPDRIIWKEGKQAAVIYVRCDNGKTSSSRGDASTKAPTSFEAGSFSLSSHGYSATIVSLTDPDTTNAMMTGKVTRADAEESCQRNSTNGDGLKPKALKKCIDSAMAEEGSKSYVSKANCASRTIIPHFGGRYTVVSVTSTGSASILNSRREDIGSVTATGGPSIQDQFEKLCPLSFKKLRRS